MPGHKGTERSAPRTHSECKPLGESLWSLRKGNGSGVRLSTPECFLLSRSPRGLGIKSNLSVLTEPAGEGDPGVSLEHEDSFARPARPVNERVPHPGAEL